MLGNNIATSLGFNDIKRMLTDYTSTRHNIENYQFQGTGIIIDGIYYYQVPEEKVQKVNAMIVES